MEALNTLIFSLPKRDSTLRMRVWRALKDGGCAVLRDGVYVAPRESKVLARIEADIRAAGGFAMAAELTPKSAEQLAHAGGRARLHVALHGLAAAAGERQ